MTFSAAQPFSARVHRLRWVLYVVLALVGGSLTFVGAHAQQKASEEAAFRKLLDNYCAAWSSGNPDILRFGALLVSQLEGISRRSAKTVF